MDSIDELADRIFGAIETGDAEVVADCYADDAIIWHNNDGISQTKSQILAVLDWMVANTASREYRAIRRFQIEGGFVQQHDLHLEFDDGRSSDIPACAVVIVSGGKVTRIDEYLDGATAAAAFSAG